jgi:carboxymethylenebutenolidase
LNDNIRATAEKLATHGYNVVAVDLYNGTVANTSEKAQQLSSSVSTDQAMQNLGSAQEYLESQGASNVASFGFCFGGDQSMQYAVQEGGPDASVVYYGTPVSNESALQRLDEPLFGAFGTDDPVVDVDTVRSFEESLGNRSGIDINYYEGAGHAFANPSGDSFNEGAASDAWNKTLDFLDRSLR